MASSYTSVSHLYTWYHIITEARGLTRQALRGNNHGGDLSMGYEYWVHLHTSTTIIEGAMHEWIRGAGTMIILRSTEVVLRAHTYARDNSPQHALVRAA